MITNFEEMKKYAIDKGPRTLAVTVAQDKHVMESVWEAYKLGVVRAILVGDKEKIEEISKELSIELDAFEIVDEKDDIQAAKKAVSLVKEGKAHILMKGLINTADIMRAVLDRENGLRTDSTISHCAVFEIKDYERLLYLTDAAMNINPDVDTKVKIINNSVGLANALGNTIPKVGVICAVEKVNPKMEATLHAQELVEKNKKGIIKKCIIGGPFALDNAISEEAAKIKGINDPIAGKVDILFVPYIEAGNVLYKSLTYFAKAKSAGIILGAKAPIVLTSRSDSMESKLNSIILGVLQASL